MMVERQTDILTPEAVEEILGTGTRVPTTREAMAHQLRVTFFPYGRTTPRLDAFVEKLRVSLRRCGATLIEFGDAIDGTTGKLRDGIVVVAPGELDTGNTPVDHAANLRRVTFMGILDRPAPLDDELHPQEKLNSIVRELAWSILQVIVYLQDEVWTICTMNGAVIRCTNDDALDGDVLGTLVPKLAAPVVPPHADDFDLREGALNVMTDELRAYADDFASSSVLWRRTGLLLFHTSVATLEFRTNFYKRIAAAYLDNRSGMSYGFLARQPAAAVRAALTAEEFARLDGQNVNDPRGVWKIGDKRFVRAKVLPEPLFVEAPDVWMLSTRSGCDKTNIDVERDLVLTGLVNGTIVFMTPNGLCAKVDCKPSYDTTAILAHAMGNALVASLLKRIDPLSRFVAGFESSGMALAHWHGDLDHDALPQGYFIHGTLNPPVSCSTHQSAIYALTGKLHALKESLQSEVSFLGDVHIEPHHGVNVTWKSLKSLAEWLLKRQERDERHAGRVISSVGYTTKS
ncbi:MAG: hypothetical protein HY961_09975 [Ignavibacteriae bacterium]|nr:hypothetical protein [Ignavibacteriota bacterium]